MLRERLKLVIPHGAVHNAAVHQDEGIPFACYFVVEACPVYFRETACEFMGCRHYFSPASRARAGASPALVAFLLEFFQKGDPADLSDKAQLHIDSDHGVIGRIVPGFDKGASMLSGVVD